LASSGSAGSVPRVFLGCATDFQEIAMTFTVRCAAAVTLTIAAVLAQAQTATQSIEVRGQLPLRTDVRALCPQIDHDLHETLVKTVQEQATAAVLDVRFELDGTRIGAVQVGPGPAAYRRMLARAVRGLECGTRGAPPQQVAMRVRFVDPFDRSASRSTAALVEPSAPAQ
jgi:hypothetical protein